ncbi:hypothetical protein [Seohaeicola zhoushanensis]|uniref:Lipoprotein n=1 Tax=Seohaeicola zhoushanensis TaxID=1569283 RepID=A0A8J3M5V2_9RHOB|nr:hypothetical protein [Seohaeicola zhoushanensis]GHF38229.1 hypothetical protein GCM10017056_07730 [Seohaeicola zhoushanensis]
MRRAFLLPLALVALAACDDIEDRTDRAGRDMASPVIAEVIGTRVPGIPKELVSPAIECVGTYAQAMEVRELAKASVTGVNEAIVTMVNDILRRPETVACMRQKA